MASEAQKGLPTENNRIWLSSINCAACIHGINTSICPAQSRLSGSAPPSAYMQLQKVYIGAGIRGEATASLAALSLLNYLF
jgi:hypothetical protein